jgi:signal transduction histidine kinase
MALLLVLFGSALYGILRRSLQAEVDRTLIETTREIQSTARRQIVPTTPFNWETVVTLAPLDVFATSDIFVQVRDPSGVTLATSANLRNQAVPSLPEEDWHRVLSGWSDLRTVKVEETRLRLHSERIVVEGELVGVLQVAASLRSTDEALQRLLSVLLVGGGIGLVLAAVGGALLAYQSLAPIAQATETARQIASTENLGERIPVSPVQDEVGRLVTTFNEMLARLERLFQGQQRFITDISHELRTPLAAIRGNIEILQRGAQNDPILLRESLQDIEREVIRMSRLVADMLVLARADAGVHLERRPVELDRLLLEVYREAHHLSRDVEVKLGSEDQLQVLGDSDRLKQLLLNLVDNAVKFTPPNGTVTLSLYREGPWACLAVSDTGIGITPEEQRHIFDRFYRGKGARRKSGTGLGLSIARWIVEEHDGQITVESQQGQGSTFVIWLPILAL